jgi:hypothetical protein
VKGEGCDISRRVIQSIIVFIKLPPGEIDLDFKEFMRMRFIAVFESFECFKQIFKCRKNFP